MDIQTLILVVIFCIGYAAIILEFSLKINKTAIELCLAVICWLVFYLHAGALYLGKMYFSDDLSDISQIIFFLLGAMTIVEIIDSHKGFSALLRYVHTQSKRKMLCIISFMTFFMSAILDNLTTTILMISILRKLVPNIKDRWILLYMVVIAANAGGAWSPIGDVTTTMLWINGQLSTLAVVKELFVPSLVCLLIPMGIYWFSLKGRYQGMSGKLQQEEIEPGGTLVLCIGVAALLFVPFFRWLTGMPPFMGVLIALAVLWLATDVLHQKYTQRHHLRVPFILTKIDVSSLLFFLGILLTMDALKAAGLLTQLGSWTYTQLQSEGLIATFIGLLSSIVDNVPLVAATMSMYDLKSYPLDASLLMMIAYAAGTGGSILLIGSSSGIMLMGLEKVSFFSYLKQATLPALLGFLGGIGVYQLLSLL